MSVWADIDKLKAKFEREFRKTAEALEGLGAVKGSLTTDEYGWWVCRYIPRLERKQEQLRARDGGGARRAARRHPQEGRAVS